MNRWCQINFFVQLGIIALAILAIPFALIYVLLFLIPFGGWQVISSLVFAIQYQKIEKRFRLMFKAYWIILGLLLLFYLVHYTGILYFRDSEIAFMIISLILGIYYFFISARMTRNRTVHKTSFLPNILDQF